MKKILLLLSFLLISISGISQIKYHSTNRMNYSKVIHIGFTYELVYPDFHSWDLYLQSKTNLGFWEWYYNYYQWRFTPQFRFSFNYHYPSSYGYYYNNWYCCFNYHYGYKWSFVNQKPNTITYNRRPVNKPIVINNRTRRKLEITRIREPQRISRPKLKKHQHNPRYNQPQPETRPRFNDSRPRQYNNTTKTNRLELLKKTNNKQRTRNSGNVSSQRKR